MIFMTILMMIFMILLNQGPLLWPFQEELKSLHEKRHNNLKKVRQITEDIMQLNNKTSRIDLSTRSKEQATKRIKETTELIALAIGETNLLQEQWINVKR